MSGAAARSTSGPLFRLARSASAGLVLALLPAPAQAQLHWDASAQAGVMKRALGDRPPGGADAGFGPAIQLAGHVALLPLVRVGVYAGHDISPMGGETSARDLTYAGLRAKIMSPWPRGSLRAWLFLGFGYAGVYARSTSAPRLFPGAPGTPSVTSAAVVDGAGGGFFEVPVGIGASYKLRKPWELCAELGVRPGFGHSGSVYEAPGPRLRSAGRPDGNALPAGRDGFAIGLTVGLLVDL
jgi:hypothetical protein